MPANNNGFSLPLKTFKTTSPVANHMILTKRSM